MPNILELELILKTVQSNQQFNPQKYSSHIILQKLQRPLNNTV